MSNSQKGDTEKGRLVESSKKRKNGIEGIIKQNDMINHNHKQITIQCYQITWSVKQIQKIKNPIISKTSSGGTMLLSKCEVCSSKNWDWSKSKKQVSCWAN